LIALNHALTGAIIGLGISDPLLALPIAFGSHFICDALPHFGMEGKMSDDVWIKSMTFKRMLIADAIGCTVLVLVLTITKPHHWFLACVCAFLATSPDFLWINMFIKNRQNKPWKPSLFSKFASNIQWFQRPSGAIIELIWFSGCLIVISTYLH
jgi:hypothetical protein